MAGVACHCWARAQSTSVGATPNSSRLSPSTTKGSMNSAARPSLSGEEASPA